MVDSSINVPVDAPAMKTIADAASMALQAQKEVSLYRCTALKISGVTGKVCAIGASVSISATSKAVARTEYAKEYGDKMVNDAAGDWVIGCIALRLGANDLD